MRKWSLLIVSLFWVVLSYAKDDTMTIQRRLDNLAITGGTVKLDARTYRISTLNIPAGVSLEGCYSMAVKDSPKGTLIHCIGAETDNAIVLNNGSSVRGLMFYYPDQKIKDGVLEHEYAATIRVASESLRNAIEDVMFVNSTRCVDAMEHHESLRIENCCGLGLLSGIRIHYSTDIDRLRNIHFNYNVLANSGNFMSYKDATEYGKYVRAHATAFVINRADWLLLDGCFCWGYRTGLSVQGYDAKREKPANFINVNIVNCGFDACGVCIKANYMDMLRISDCNCVSFYPATTFGDKDKPQDYLTEPYSIMINGGCRTNIDNVNFWGIAGGYICAAGEIVHIANCMFGEGDTSQKGSYSIELNNYVSSVDNCVFDARRSPTIKGILINGSATTSIQGNIFNSSKGDIITKSQTSSMILGDNLYVNCKESIKTISK